MNNWAKVNLFSGFLNPSLYICLTVQFFISKLLYTLWLKESINIRIPYGINYFIYIPLLLISILVKVVDKTYFIK